MSEKMKKCPKCGEDILFKAIKCKHCNSDLRSWFRRHPLVTIFIILPITISMFSAALDETEQTKTSLVASQQETEFLHQKQAQEKIDQIEIVSYEIKNDVIGTPNLVVNFKNNSEKTIDALTIEAYLFNNYNEPIGKWNNNKKEAFVGTIQESIKPGETLPAQWSLTFYDHATKADNVNIVRIHYEDGEEISVN